MSVPNGSTVTSEKSPETYAVEIVDVDTVLPSPENDEIYGKIGHDEQMNALVESIRSRGLAEPIIVSDDDYIVSGHRRFYACCHLGYDEIPVRRLNIRRRDRLSDWAKLLTEYNPQRVKTAGSLLREALLRHSDEDPRALLKGYREASIQVDADFLEVSGVKTVADISEKKGDFLAAAKLVVNNMRKFWPLTVRQIHYQLLNDPPLITRPKRSKFNLEHYRYRNDKRSYDALVELLKQARYAREIRMDCIDDPTRPKFANNGFTSVSQFIEREMAGFLCGYHLDRQLDQPRHIEVLGEKGTLLGIVQPICKEYYVPLTLGRGYTSHPVWRDMAARFSKSGKPAMTLIIASDYDPEGLDLADDAIRSLRDLWDIPADYHRVGVTRSQIDELDLATDFNPAKTESSRFNAFVKKTGSNETWELESLPPEYLQEQIRAAIEANMNMDSYRDAVGREENEASELARIRREIVDALNF